MARNTSFEKLREKLLTSYRVDGECWIWTKSLNCWGYGQSNYKNKKISAHRLMYETFVGQIPKGLDLDHLCRNRACVNPEHLEPVTERENQLRSPITFAGINHKKTHCINGHRFTLENTYTPPKRPSRRYCKACQIERDKLFKFKMKVRVAS